MPIWIKLSCVVILFLFLLFLSLDPNWLNSLKSLSALPLQRYKWKFTGYLKTWSSRIFSFLLFCIILAFVIILYNKDIRMEPWEATILNLGIAFGVVCIAYCLKYLIHFLCLKTFGAETLANRLIDYQLSFNVFISILFIPFLILEIFSMRFSTELGAIFFGVLALALIFRLWGTIIIFLADFKYSFLLLFIYLCTFEFIPLLVAAKVLLT